MSDKIYVGGRRVNDSLEPIRQRALTFAESLDWHNAVIVDESDADPGVVQLRGSGDPALYRKFRIELDMRPERRAHYLKLAERENQHEMEAFLSGTWVLDVTCSATDIIEADWPHID
jgi:hypothetical protein